MNLKQHALSAYWPAMSAEDFQTLKDSIEAIGVQNPITLYEGMVLDGWNRYRAANELGMDCPTVDLGDVDPRDFVRAVNDARRHMTHAARALAITSVYGWLPVGNPDLSNSALSAELKTTKELAAIAGVGARSIEQAKVVQTEAAPEVVEAVKRGEVGLPKAAAIAKLPQDQQAAALAKPAPKAMKAAVPEPNNSQLAEAAHAITELANENEKLRDRLAIEAMDASAEEKTEARQTIADLRAQIKTLEMELDAVKASRDGYQRHNADLMKQVQIQQRQLKKLGA